MSSGIPGGKYYCYYSPFRKEERTPSFKIEKGTNHWVDFGKCEGLTNGSIIDFGIEFYSCSVTEFLERLSSDMGLSQVPRQSEISRPPKQKESPLKITEVRPLSSPKLQHYLASRGISFSVAQAWCSQVEYRIGRSCFTAIGFKNDEGGFDLRNPSCKHASVPKTYRLISPPAAVELNVFEAFMDFLIRLSLQGTQYIMYLNRQLVMRDSVDSIARG
jgi:hypothetical protein